MIGIKTTDTRRLVWGPDAGLPDRAEWVPIEEAASNSSTVVTVRPLSALDIAELPEAGGDDRRQWAAFWRRLVEMGVVEVEEAGQSRTASDLLTAPAGVISLTMVTQLGAAVLEFSTGKQGPT